MAIPRPRKRRGPMSLAQKIALKKAQEASARARRGTGKPDEPKKLRPKAKDYRAKVSSFFFFFFFFFFFE